MSEENKNNDDVKTDSLEEKLAEAEKKAEENLAGWQRALADYQNLQKEVSRDREVFIKFANEQILFGILPVLDHLNQAITQSPKLENKSDAEWVSGIGHILDGLKSVLKNHGLEEIKVEIGSNFDPEKQESVNSRHEDGKESGLILEEIRKGYLLNGKIIRPAQVVVSN